MCCLMKTVSNIGFHTTLQLIYHLLPWRRLYKQQQGQHKQHIQLTMVDKTIKMMSSTTAITLL